MIPDYCVPDALAATGSIAPYFLLGALVVAVMGICFKVEAKRRSALLIGFLAVGALTLSVGVMAPNANANAPSTTKTCPTGYHYDISRDKGTTPTSLERFRISEDNAKVKTQFTMKDDGSTGKTASGEDIINWDIAKKTIRTYMNADSKGIANKTDSPYVREVSAKVAAAASEVAPICTKLRKEGKKPAAVFDADDTTLFTYDMEDGYMNFSFTPVKQQKWFDENYMPATPGMVEAVKKMADAGCTIIGLTGRNTKQADYTILNLEKAGYVDAAGKPLFNKDLYFTKFVKDEKMPVYLEKFCDTTKNKCNTVQYKAGTREHIQTDLGYVIVGNFGDQWSDLMGGRQMHYYKLPNATYYLPSPNLPDWEAKDKAAGMAPSEKTYTVLPDGSSGKTTPGDDLPNMDIVKATIRAYYNAQDGTGENAGQKVANKTDSAYIKEMNSLKSQWVKDVTSSCSAAKARGERPAITLDADDTTLWCYDMEEWLEFAFSKTKQDEYLKNNYHALPAVPGMVDVVKAATDSGCTVIGLTGRSHDLREVTLRNLNEVKYNGFTDKLYFTKISSKASEQEHGVKCAGEKCTTVEYKAGTRGYIEHELGFRIVGNFGDQWSDLLGGYQDKLFKLPNPTYYLP